MKKTAFIFPGQASQYVGMAKDIFEEYDLAKEMFGEASGKLGFDLADACFNGPEEKLKQTAYTQPAVFVHSAILNAILNQNGIAPEAAAGHSLGEYSALVSAGCLEFADAIKAIELRSRKMQVDCDNNPGTMAAVMGMEYNEVKEILENAEGIVVPANYNSPGQVVIAGEVKAIDHACTLLKNNGAKRALPIPVGGAYHSPLMKSSSEIMAEYIENELKMSNLRFPVYSNVSGTAVDDVNEFRKLLTRQISNPVQWYPIIENMYNDGIRNFIEIGPGKVLQGLIKRSLKDPEVEFSGIDTLNELNIFMENNVKAGI